MRQADLVLRQCVTIELEPYRRAALLSLVMDLVAGLATGGCAFGDSKLVASLNQGQYQLAASEFFSFCHVAGKVDRRLWEKRNCEQNLFRRGRLILGH